MKALYKLKPLPESLGEAFLLAVREADRLYNLKEGIYMPDSDRWHSGPDKEDKFKDDKLCEICLAGALIANAGVDPKEDAGPYWAFSKDEPDYFSVQDRNRLRAINGLRHGWFKFACELWYGKSVTDKPVVRDTIAALIERVDSDPIEWHGLDEWRVAKPDLIARGKAFRILDF